MKSTIKLERQYTAPYKRGRLVIALLLLCLTLSGVVVARADVEVSGHVYLDANANGHRENDEGGTGLTLWANLVDKDNNVINTQVDSVTGEYTFDNVTETGSPYSIVISDNATATNTPMAEPPGYIGTEFLSFMRSVIVNSSYVYNQNFGLFKGSKVSGTIFKDNGEPTGTANNGIKNGDEKGIAGVNVKVTNSDGSVTYATTTTDSEGNYAVYIQGSITGDLKVTETNPSGYLSTGGNLDGDTSKYVRGSDTISFTFDPNIAAYENINFGDVPQSTFTLDGNRTVVPGGAVFFPHVFTAGTDGTVTFSTSNTSSPNNAGWTHLIYRDDNHDGILDVGESLVTAPISVTAGEKVSLIIKENAPANVTDGAQDVIEITANFELTGIIPAVTETLKRNDVTNVNTQTELHLVKTVASTSDPTGATAEKGEYLTYTITYTNNSDQPIKDLVIDDFVPAFTTFVDAPQPASFPAGLTAVTIGKPPVDGIGRIKWTFTGELDPGASGIVTFEVKVNG